MKRLLLASLALACLPFSQLHAEILEFRALLSGASESPANASTASGIAAVTFDSSTKAFTAYVTLRGFTNTITGSHIHEGAAGANGPVVNNFGGAASYITAAGGFAAAKFSGTYAGDVAKLLSEGAYVNVHSNVYAGGEIRGQLVRVPAPVGHLFNLSTLGRVDALPLTIGFSLAHEQRVALRSLGRSLGQFGVSGAVNDTQLMLFNASGQVIAQNDNWKTAQNLAVNTAGFPPFDNTDSALVLTLAPGNYTAMVPTGRGPGAVLIDAFAVPQDSLASGLTKAGTFGTLLAAVQTAGLLDVVLGPGPFTLFAPTDEAFAKLPAGTVETLLKPENRATLVSILLYHIVPAKVLSTQLSNGLKADTLLGAQLTVDLTAGVKINTSNVTEADWTVSNGVIHVIDTVLLPPAG